MELVGETTPSHQVQPSGVDMLTPCRPRKSIMLTPRRVRIKEHNLRILAFSLHDKLGHDYEGSKLAVEDARRKAEEANQMLEDAEKAKAAQKGSEQTLKEAAKAKHQAMKALGKASVQEEVWRKLKVSIQAANWKENTEEATLPEDTGMSNRYSKYVSFSKVGDDFPIMSWTLSEEQLAELQKIYLIAAQLPREQVMAQIKKILSDNAERIKAGMGFWFDIPIRKPEYLHYSEYLAMPLLLRGHLAKRSFTNKTTRSTACMTAWMLNELYEAVRDRKFLTLREIYYRGTLFFKSPKQAAGILTDITCMLGCTTSSLNVIAEETGSVIGALTLKLKDGAKQKNDAKQKKGNLSCINGIHIPYDVNDIADVVVHKGKVEFVLVVEKGTIYNHLCQAKVPKEHKCIMVTGYGMPDERTRSFVRLLEEKTGLPIFGITDPDPYGIGIMKTYAKGSTNLAHCNIRLAVPAIHWLGITTSDIQDLEEEKKVQILKRCPHLNSRERVMLRNLLESDKYNLSVEWKRLIKHMLDRDRKTSFEVLHVFGQDFITKQHIPFLIDRVLRCIDEKNDLLATSTSVKA